MGLDLKPLITASPIALTELSGKVVAVDAYNTIYQFLSTIRGPTGELLTNSKGEVTSHLSGLFYRNINLLMENIKPVYVFDGEASALKLVEIERRQKIKQEAAIKYQQAIEEGRTEDALKYSKRTAVLTTEMVDQSKKLLSFLGIPHVQAISDGEAAAAYLTEKEIAYAAASQDYDSVLYGATRLVRNLAIGGKRKGPGGNVYVDIEPEIIEYSKVLEETRLNREQLVDVGILIGTDFNPGGFPGIGPKTALKLIHQYTRLENIEKIRSFLSDVPFQEIRELFLKPANLQLDELKFNDVNFEKVIEFLCIEKNFSTERVSTMLERLKKTIANRSQSLEKWFG